MFIAYTLRTEPWSNSRTSYPLAIHSLQLSDAPDRLSRLSPANGENNLLSFVSPRSLLPILELAFTLAEYGLVCTGTISVSNTY